MSAASSSSTSVPETPRERNNRVVKELSARVVSGWTLLASTCPECHTALVRSRDGSVYCVACRMDCVTVAEAKQRNISAASSTSSTQPRLFSPVASTVTSPPPPSSRDSSFASPLSPPLSSAHREQSARTGEGLVTLSSSPFFSQLRQQLQDVNELDAAAASSAASSSAAEAAAAQSDARVEAAKARTNRVSAELGRRLLAGWTLLGLHCADDACLCPLMKDPKTGERLCVACGATYGADGQAAAASAVERPTAPTPASAAPSTSALVSLPAPAAAASSSSSSSVASLPVIGYVNGSAPRAQSAASGLVGRGGRRAQDEDEEEEDDEAPLAERVAVTLSDPAGNTSRASSGASRPAASSPVDVSGLLSEKLLQGWTMLAAECPNPSCSCPLMRRKQGPMLCVQCGSTVVTQEEKDRMDTAQTLPEQQPAENREQRTAAQRKGEEQEQRGRPKARQGTSSGGRVKRAAFEDQREDEEEQAERAAPEGVGKARAAAGEEDLSDRLSSLSSASLVHSLSQSPLVRQHHRPTAISSSVRKFAPAPLTDSSPATRTPPSTPAPFPFASPLPSSAHLSASISSSFSQPLFPPPGHITRNNSQASDAPSSHLSLHQQVGLGSLSFALGPATVPAQRQAQHAQPGHERGKFSFRSASAAPAVSHQQQQQQGGAAAGGALTVPVGLSTGEGSAAAAGGVVTPIGVSPVHLLSSGSSGSAASGSAGSIIAGSVEALYGKLDALRGLLVTCSSVEQMTAIAAAMKEVGHALKALQTL